MYVPFLDYKSAFTAYGIVPTEGFYGNIVMGGVTTDIGGHYEAFTGQFTCQYSGVYVFTVNLYSKTSAYCYIRKNTQNQVYAEVEALVDVFAESSSSVVLQLMRGDKVDVGDCFAANRLASFTSFTGFLLYPDLL